MFTVLPRKHWSRLPQRGSGQMWRCGLAQGQTLLFFGLSRKSSCTEITETGERVWDFLLPSACLYLYPGLILGRRTLGYCWPSQTIVIPGTLKSFISVTNYKANAFSMNSSFWSRQFRLKRPRVFRKAELHHRGR